MAKLRFKIQKVTPGYMEVELIGDELKKYLSSSTPAVEKKDILQKARGYAERFDPESPVWQDPAYSKIEVCKQAPVLVYDFTDPVIIGEELEDAGGGNMYLTYKIRVIEDGEPSIIYGFYVPDVDVVTYQRVSVNDTHGAYYSGLEEWFMIGEDLTINPEFECITNALKERGTALDHKGYNCRLYSAWPHIYNPEDTFENEDGDQFTQVFKVVRRGKTMWYGCPVKNGSIIEKICEAGSHLYRMVRTPLYAADEPQRNEESKTTFNILGVLSEEIAYTGGGVNYLVYEVAVKEDGQDSVLFIAYNPYDKMFLFRRASILDPYETEGDEEWCDVPEGIEDASAFYKLLAELKQATMMKWHGLYVRKYPEREYKYKPDAVYVDPDNGKTYKQVFPIKKKGETILYGYIVDENTQKTDYGQAIRIGAKSLVIQGS